MQQTQANAARAQQARLQMLQLIDRFGIVLVLLLMVLGLSMLRPATFPTAENFANIGRQVPFIALLALGQFFVVLTAGIDLSVGSVMALSMVTLALGAQAGLPTIVLLLIPLLVGLGVGALNGLGLTWLRLPHPFIMTLGTQYIARGATNLVTGGVPISGLPEPVRWFGAGDLRLVRLGDDTIVAPVAILLVFALYGLAALFLNRTRTGRHIYAVGGNPQAALYAGINVDRVLLVVYCASGLLAGLAGLILAGRTNSGYPNAGIGDELYAIAAVIIGGASFFGGRGSVLGVLSGVLIIGLLRNGLNLLNISVFWQQVLIGVVIVAAVYGDVLRQRFARK
ncbi:MAG TPA: ABC transporter permease [Herpetosiphonaceae bacterium]